MFNDDVQLCFPSAIMCMYITGLICGYTPIWEVLGLDFSKINLSVLLNTMFIIEAMMEL